MSEPTENEIEVFSAALELPPAERAAYLNEACGGNATLRQRVEELLAAREKAGGFLESGTGAIPGPGATIRITAVASEKAGDRIGRYKLLQQIGEGGCGIVYMAEQEEPVRRRVALKVIKLGMDTKEVIVRFEAERQALALMDHPNIARVFDAGATETGRPYFVMELVKGISITRYCDENNLSTPARLTLFIQVCKAIQHAHQKGIIHRDIKPSNVLVADHDGVPVPKIIDFGIAKATTDQRLTNKTLFTAFEQFIGTPAYMSPEQAKLSGLDIDTRSDIYSLGVLLYELLTGRTPFESRRLHEAGLDEIRRIIREEEPVRPSTKLNTLNEAEQTTVARQRQTDLPKLASLLSGDLDWIVMKALEKDRGRRYETATGLAADIERHLKNEPVLARPPSNVYRLQRTYRRNKLVFTAVAAVAVSLIVGIIVSCWQAVRAKRAEREQTRLRVEADAARTGEAQQRMTAEQRLYDSLLAQARALRNSRREGYRDAVFPLLKQANALNVPQKKPADLCREAVACMGDFIALTPATIADFSTNAEIEKMRLSATGKMAAFGLSDGTISLRQLPSGAEATRLAATDSLRNFCFSADGTQLLILHSPKQLDDFVEEKARVQIATVGADGQWSQTENISFPGAFDCLSSSNGFFVATRNLSSPSGQPWQIVNVKTREALQSIEFEDAFDTNRRPMLAMTPDGKWLAVSSKGSRDWIDIWNLNTHRRVKTLKGRGMPRIVQFSPDGKQLASLWDRGCDIFSLDGFEHVGGFETFIPRRVSQISFEPGQTVIALPLMEHSRVRLWDWARNRDAAILEEAAASSESAFAPDASFLLTCDERQARIQWLGQTSEKINVPTHQGTVNNSAAFSPDGIRIASIETGRTLRMSDAASGREFWETTLGGTTPLVAYHPNGRWLATACHPQSRLQFRDASNGKLILDLGTNEVERSVFLLQFSKDGHRLVGANYPLGRSYENPPKVGSSLDVWTIQDGTGGIEVRPEKLARPALDVQAYSYFVLAPDGRHAACFASEDRIYVCDLDGLTPPQLMDIRVETGLTPYGQYVCFTPDSSQLVVMDTNRDIVTLDAATGKKASSFPTIDSGKPTSWDLSPDRNISLSPDGTKLAVDSIYDRSIDLYDLRQGRPLYSLPDQNAQIKWMTWSSDSQRLALSLDDGELAIWNLAGVEQVLAKLQLSP